MYGIQGYDNKVYIYVMHPKKAQVPAKVVQNLMYMWQQQQCSQQLQDYTNIPEVQVLLYTCIIILSCLP